MMCNGNLNDTSTWMVVCNDCHAHGSFKETGESLNKGDGNSKASGSVPTEKSDKRKSGYYWIRLVDEWAIAVWSEEKGKFFLDSYPLVLIPDEIGERIIPPNQQQP